MKKEIAKFVDVAGKGDLVELVCQTFKETRMTQTNSPYWDLTLVDKTGTAYAKIWSGSHLFEFFESFSDGDTLSIKGVISKDYPNKRIDIQTVKLVEAPESQIVDIPSMRNELGLIIRSIEDPGLQQLLHLVFNRPGMAKQYFYAPMTLMATSGGSWKGGVPAFVTRMCYLIDAVSEGFMSWPHSLDGIATTLNRDFLKTLAILEPIGRVRAFHINRGKVNTTEEGDFLGEHFLTMEVVLEELSRTDMPNEKKLLLKHALASSPGRSDWGALIQDRTKEAIAFNIIWNLNMQMMHFEQLERSSHDNSPRFVNLFRKRVALDTFKVYKPIGDEKPLTAEQDTETTDGQKMENLPTEPGLESENLSADIQFFDELERELEAMEGEKVGN